MEDINITESPIAGTNVSMTMPEPPLYIIIVAGVMYGLTFILGIFGNINVIIIVCRFKSMRSRMNYFLVNLSITDMFILLLCIPSAAVDLLAKEAWYFGEAACKIVPFVEHVVTLSSVLTILMITWDRYKGICNPLKYIEERNKVTTAFITIWSIALFASIPMLFFPVFRDSHFHDGTPIKVCRMPIIDTWKLVYLIVIFTVFFCVMFILMVYFYAKICRALSERRTFISQSADRYAKKILQERRQMIRLMLVVVIMFFVCLLPQRAVGLWFIFADESQLLSLRLEGYLLLKTFTRVMVYMNSAVNPIIYNFTSTHFRQAFKHTLCHKIRQYNPVNGGRTEAAELTTMTEWKCSI